MAKGNVNWETQETWQRVIAAILATGVKIDLKQTAMYFGTTYDTLENRFRKIKKESATLKQEVENGERGEIASARGKSSAPSTPRKATPKKNPLGTVNNGRVAKPTPKKTNKIKQEVSDDSFASTLEDDLLNPNDMSFGTSFHMGYGDPLGDTDDLLL